MADTTFTNNITQTDAGWFNDVNAKTYHDTAANIPNVPAGGVASTNVQTAVNELDTKKQALTAVHASATKATPVDTDELSIQDSAATPAFSLAKLTWANLKATLVVYLSALTTTWGISTTGNAATASNATLAANLSGTPAVPNGTTATTQTVLDSTTKLATTGFVNLTKRLLQFVTNFSGTVATGTTIIPYDNTIPQQTEGDQYFSLAITPLSATSILEINVMIRITSSAASNNLIVAVFQDATANALKATSMYSGTATSGGVINFTFFMTSGTTSATTFKVRAGAGAAGTTTINGYAGGGTFGGTEVSGISIKEWL